ncbi:MAG: mechanosensitive ion channel family protein [Acidimicrobiia bacterium]
MLLLKTPEQLLELQRACGDVGTRGKLCELAYDLTKSQHVAEIADTFSKPVRVLLIILGAYLVNLLVRFFIRRSVKKLAKESSRIFLSNIKRRTGISRLETSEHPTYRTVQRAQTIGMALRGIATFTIIIVSILLILGTYHIKLGPIIAGAGLIGVVVGFGAQSMIKDFLAGIFIIVEDWYGVGDVIDAGEASGTVEQVTLRATRLRDVYGVVWHIPNGVIQRAGNKSQQWGRALLDIGVALDTDIELAQRVIKETSDALASDPNYVTEVLDEPDVLGVEEIGTDRIVIRVILKTTPASQWKIARELRARIKAAFDENQIEFPPPSAPGFPRDVMK